VSDASGRPEVSVVVSTYRTPEPLLRIGLTSLLGQTLADLVVVLVADGDLESEADACVDALASADPRLRVLRPGRIGRPRALNEGVDAARAELVAIQDADDASHPRRLEIELGLLRAVGELSVIGSAARFTTSVTDDGGGELPTRAARVRRVDRALLRSNAVVHSSMVMRKAPVVEVGGYDEGRRAQFDYDLLLRLRDAGYAIGVCDLPLVVHRRHGGQFFEGLAPIQRAWSSCRLQLDHLGELPPITRFAYTAVAAGRFGYQVGRGVLWHAAQSAKGLGPA
jgi:glycosyltransferase involved in cell wall biosynthesis